MRKQLQNVATWFNLRAGGEFSSALQDWAEWLKFATSEGFTCITITTATFCFVFGALYLCIGNSVFAPYLELYLLEKPVCDLWENFATNRCEGYTQNSCVYCDQTDLISHSSYTNINICTHIRM